MRQVNTHEAKTRLSELIASGEEIVIARYGEPVARLMPIKSPVARRTPGSAKGMFTIPSDPFIPSELLKNRVESLHITDAHAFRAAQLPSHLRDPFDRMLVAQAQIESIILISQDALLRQCDVDIR